MNGGFGDYLKELRLRKGLSQRELARASGLDHSEISRIEGGYRPSPSPESLAKLAPHLGVAHEDLMLRLGYLSPGSLPALGAAIRRTLEENESVRSLVMRLARGRLSQAGRDYLAAALREMDNHLDLLEQVVN
ncbi:MAG: helix-turn-helix domain-containing protein [Patescibacteria group bacterium]